MAESLAAFHARVDGFSVDSLPHAEGLTTRGSLTVKVGPDGSLRPFFGNTVLWELDGEAKLALCQRQTLVHHRAGGCLAQPLAPQTFHVTLHDLVSGPDPAAIAADMARAEQQTLALLDALRREGIPPIRMVSTHVFSMVATSVVMGFAPETEGDCAALMALYERFHEVLPLSWLLTPHVTLAYYRPGQYGQDAVDALSQAFAESAALPPIRITLQPGALVLRRFSDMNHYF